MEEALCKRSFERTTQLFTIDDNYVNEKIKVYDNESSV